MTQVDPEVELLSREAGKKLAEEKRKLPDPFATEISPSLLSAEHIEKYVLATGLIAPFFKGGGKDARLKKASYEGRMGERAFMYNEEGARLSLAFEDGILVVPHNSIVFVESDLDFRLPEYIALRFNLQIRHVHRGLLLGTGPLVDPGYWGKLCIPLHNLTDHDYAIPRMEGLIWVEFTRTTSKLGTENPGRIPLEKDQKEYWNIEDFIEKAARPFRVGSPTVPIRSSIPEAIATANEASQRAEDASRAAQSVNTIFNRIAWIGAAVTVVAVVALWLTFWGTLSPRIDALTDGVASIRSSMGAEGAKLANQTDAIQMLSDELKETNARVEELRAENSRLRARFSRGR